MGEQAVTDAAALCIAIALALLWIAWPDRQRRAWALVTIAGAAFYLALRELPALLPGAPWLGVHWNWSGHLLGLGGMLAFGALLVRRAGLDRRALGLACPLAWRPAAAVALAALLLNFIINSASSERLEQVPVETWLFLATMPGLVEEITFRGVLLAAAERAAPAKRRVAGVWLGPGALALTLAFVALHGLGLGTLLSVLPAALLYLWLRLRTGSVLLPIVAHNLWNLIVIATHL